ncbi:UNVERIFIED_CONTAM: hypothetical protein FKN15_039309 [Acipenser sinensis]
MCTWRGHLRTPVTPPHRSLPPDLSRTRGGCRRLKSSTSTPAPRNVTLNFNAFQYTVRRQRSHRQTEMKNKE